MISACVQVTRYITHVEAIDTQFLLRQLYQYLTCLTSPDSEAFLPILQKHLEAGHTWFAKAKLFDSLNQQIESIDDALRTAGEDVQLLLQDSKRRLEYVIQRADSECLEQINQICHGMHVLFDEKLVLDDIREEITGFLREKSYRYDPEVSKEVYEQRLARLEQSSVVNSLRQLTAVVKRLPIQTDLFLKKYVTAEAASASARQLPDIRLILQNVEAMTTLQEAEALEIEIARLKNSRPALSQDLLRLRAQRAVNQQGVNQLLEDVKTTVELGRLLLSEAVFQRLSSRLSVLSVAKVQQNYAQAEKNLPQQLDDDAAARLFASVYAGIRQKKDAILQQKQQAELARYEEQYKALEYAVNQVTGRIAEMKQVLDGHRKRLACIEKLKQCYSRYSPVLLAQAVKDECQSMRQALSDLVHLLEVDVPWARLEKNTQDIQSLQAAQMQSRTDISEVDEQIEALMSRMKEHLAQARQLKLVPWQDKLSRLLLHAQDEKLRESLVKFSRLALIPNTYLRVLLLAKFAQIDKKLTLNSLSVMATWREPNLDAAVIKSTLAHLGIVLSSENFAKICPPKRWKFLHWIRQKWK